MIGKTEWFDRRKYGGWGLHPRTWQGWVYIALFLGILAVFQAIPIWDTRTRITFTAVWIAILMLDVTHIMINLRKDERENKIEAISERNAAWVMVLIIIIGILYQIIRSGLNMTVEIDPFLVAALFGGMIIKSISNIMLEKRAL